MKYIYLLLFLCITHNAYAVTPRQLSKTELLLKSSRNGECLFRETKFRNELQKIYSGKLNNDKLGRAVESTVEFGWNFVEHCHKHMAAKTFIETVGVIYKFDSLIKKFQKQQKKGRNR